MNKNVKNQLKESFCNIQFILIFILTILCLVLYFVADIEILLDVFLFGLLLIILFIVGFFRRIKMRNNVSKIKNGELKYAPFIVKKEDFIKDCYTGLMYSIIRIDNVIYEVETQLDEVNSTNYDNFTCYINDNEIKGVDNFLNFKYDGNHTFNDLEKIEFLEYNNNDPKKYFVDKSV